MSTPAVAHRSLAVPRAGSEPAESEDAAAVSAEAWPVCAAVADGATESVFAGRWAQHLVQGLAARRATTGERLRDAVADWREEWQAGARAHAEQRPWYVAAKAAEGAFAALLGLSLRADGQWRAVSVGDCCFFHVRDGNLVQSWPFASPDAFTNRPALVSSRSDQAELSPETAAGTWQSQDAFLLATDALAAGLLRAGASEASDAPLSLANAVDWNEETFSEVVDHARAEGTLRNDDSTLLVLRLKVVSDHGQ